MQSSIYIPANTDWKMWQFLAYLIIIILHVTRLNSLCKKIFPNKIGAENVDKSWFLLSLHLKEHVLCAAIYECLCPPWMNFCALYYRARLTKPVRIFTGFALLLTHFFNLMKSVPVNASHEHKKRKGGRCTLPCTLPSRKLLPEDSIPCHDSAKNNL